MIIEPVSWEEIEFFSRSEWACQHCGRCEVDETFVMRIDELRRKYGMPLRITSGYRCPEHNAAVSSTGHDGPHTTGRAVDLAVSRGDAYQVLKIAMAMGGFSGFGFAQRGSGRFLHIDDLRNDETVGPRPTIWSY